MSIILFVFAMFGLTPGPALDDGLPCPFDQPVHPAVADFHDHMWWDAEGPYAIAAWEDQCAVGLR